MADSISLLLNFAFLILLFRIHLLHRR
jgi:hypothetical protein